MNLKVVSCQESQLASDFANALDIPFIKVKTGMFADTEIYVDAKEADLLIGSEVLLMHQFCLSNPQNNLSINDQLTALLLMSDFLKNIGVKKITAILPYLAYSRQDQSFDGRFTGPIKMWGHFFDIAGINNVIACDLHSSCLFDLMSVTLKEISLAEFWANFLASNFGDEINKGNLCIVSPDEGGFERANKIASILNVPVARVQKMRVAPDSPVALKLEGEVKSKTVIVVDDIIDTGKTAEQACHMLKMYGASKIVGIFSHAVLSGGAVQRLGKSEFNKIFVTDTLLTPVKNLHKKISVCSINKYLIERMSENI